jgi:hypothetical protein
MSTQSRETASADYEQLPVEHSERLGQTRSLPPARIRRRNIED